MNNCCKGLFWISQGKVATGEVEKSARFSCEISQDLMCQKSLKSVNLWQSYSTNKRWTFWGYGVYLFCGWNPHPPRKTSLGAWIGVFKPNGQNIESFILSKLLHQFQQVLQNDRDYQVFNVGYPNTRPTNPKWRTAAILRKKLLNRHIFATVDRFRWNLTLWRILAPYVETTTTISNFWISKMRSAAILKNTKIASSLEQFDGFSQNLVGWCKLAPTVKSVNFNNPGWRKAAIFKNVKSPHVCCKHLTYFDEIWDGDGH